MRANATQYVRIEGVPPRLQYQWLEIFVQSVEDMSMRKRMEAAINGKGAFRRFKDILSTEAEQRKHWFDFRDEKMRQHIIGWVDELGIDATNEPDWLTQTPITPGQASPASLQTLRDVITNELNGVDLNTPEGLEALCATIEKLFRVHPR